MHADLISLYARAFALLHINYKHSAAAQPEHTTIELRLQQHH